MEVHFDRDRTESSGLHFKSPPDATLFVWSEPATAQLEHADLESAYPREACQLALGYTEYVSMGA